MQPLVEITTTPTPAQAVTHQPADGAQPPIKQATPVAQQDEQTREEKARALLKGEPPKDAEPDFSEEASIDAHFDLETDDLLPIPESGDRRPESSEAVADSPADETPAAEAEAEEDEDEEPDGGVGKARRIRIKRDALSDRDFAILTLAKDKKMTFAEAEEQLFGKTTPREEDAVPHSRDAKEPSAQELSNQIGALRAAREKARDDLDDDRADQLNDQIADLRERLREAHRIEAARSQNQMQIASQRYATMEAASINRVTELYPEANTKGSRLHEAMQAKAESFQAEDPAFFQNPKWPLHLAVETATELGIAALVKGEIKGSPAPAARPAPKAAPLVIPKKTIRPIPMPAPGSATSARNNHNTEAALREELKVATSNRDVEGIRSVMRKLTAAV